MGSQDPSQIVAPMPGKIIKIEAQVGMLVQPGDLLVVMEAMKMEYKLKAACIGSVEKILCGQGDQVPVGETLIVLKEKENG